MSKRTIYAALLLCTVLTVAASCSKEATGEGGAAGTGVLEMNISTTRAEADAEYDPKDHLVARIYNSRNELIRKYTSETFVKQLELIAGEYRIAVEAGEAVPASLTFTVTPGETTQADVNCRRQNTAAEVKFDASVATAFGTDFRFWIVADDAFDEEKAEQEAVPALKYTSDATGYFTLPEGVTTFVWHFEGTHSERRRTSRPEASMSSPACSRRTCRGSSNASSSRSTPTPTSRTTRSFSVPTPPSRATASTSPSLRATSPATPGREATNSRPWRP